MPANIHQWAAHSLKSGVCVHLTLLPPRLWSFCTYPFPPLENPTSWHHPQEYNLSSSLCQDDLAHLRHIDWNSSGNFWVIFFKERKTPDTTEKKLLNAVQLSGLVPHWREQLANSSSKAVRIFALSLLWLSSLQERHVATADSSITASCSRAVMSHLWVHLTQFKKGVLGVRTE